MGNKALCLFAFFLSGKQISQNRCGTVPTSETVSEKIDLKVTRHGDWRELTIKSTHTVDIYLVCGWTIEYLNSQ